MNGPTSSRGRHGRRIRMTMRPRMRMQMAMKVTAGISMLIMVGLIFYFQFSNINNTRAASGTTIYRTKATGNWNSNSTWEKYNGSAWVAATSAPDKNDGTIEILAGHTVTVNLNLSVDQMTVDAGATVVVSSGQSLTIEDGAGTDLINGGTLTVSGSMEQKSSSTFVNNGTLNSTGSYRLDDSAVATINHATTISGTVRQDASSSFVVSDTLSLAGTFTLASGATVTLNSGGVLANTTGTTSSTWLNINSGGTYRVTGDGAAIPVMTWPAGSTVEITGVISTAPSNLDQSFSNLTWNCSGQTSKIDLNLTNATTINGDLKVVSTGSSAIRITKNNTSSLSIGGNYVQTGGTVYVSFNADYTINIAGNYTQSGGSFNVTDGSTTGTPGSGNITVNLTGNLSISGGTLDMSQYEGNSSNKGIGTFNVTGNYSQTGGVVTKSASGTGYGEFYFNKSGTQTFSKTAGTISSTVNFTVNSGSILDMGTSYPTGSGTFTASSGSGLILAATTGITSSASSGNVQVTGTRSFSTGADYTYNGSSAQVAGSGLPSTVHNLTLNNSSGLTLTNTVAVSNLLTLTSGKMNTGSNEVSVTNTSTSSVTGQSSSSYVVGDLRRSVSASDAYDFPVGTSANYELITVTLSSASGFSNILATFTNSNPIAALLPLTGLLLNGNAINRMLDYGYWTLTPNNSMSGGSYTVAINERGHSNSASNSSSYCVVKRSSVLSSWQLLGTQGASSEVNSVVSASTSGLTSFSHFAPAYFGGSLPVELLAFKAKFVSDHIALNWSTATEINNDYFTIERSQDGVTFEEVLRKPGSGNSTHRIDYSAIDDAPLHGVSYYRLKQTDYDGRFETFPLKVVQYGVSKMDGENNIAIKTVGPNPFTDSFRMNYELAAPGEVELQITNYAGQLIYKETVFADKGINNYSFTDQQGLPPGVYIISVASGEDVITQKIIKQ